MQCLICGKETKKIFRIDIDGNFIDVCEDCKSYGKIVSIDRIEKPNYAKKDSKNKDLIEDENFDLIENYGEIIKRRREELNLSIQDLAKKLGIKESLLSKIERCEILPDENVVKKIENLLKIKIRFEIKDGEFKNRKKIENEKLTIADVVEIK